MIETKTAERKNYIDIAKAIGIIMVVWAHAEGPFSKYMTAFHMPLFFFLSGMLFQCPTNYVIYLKRKLKSLLVPFWIWNYLLLIPFWLLFFWKNWNFKVLLKYAIMIGLTLDKVPMLGATWFLPALFWVSCVFGYIYIILNKTSKYKNAILFIIGILLCVVGMKIQFPFRISRTLICSLFYVLGYLFNCCTTNKKRIPVVDTVSTLVCFYVFIYFTKINNISLGSAKFKYPVLFVVGACLAIYVVIDISKRIELFKKKIIVKHIIWLGQNTMPIVIWQFIFFRLAIIIQIIVKKIPLNCMFAFPIYDASGMWWSVYIITGIYGSLLWNYIIKKVQQGILKYRIHENFK